MKKLLALLFAAALLWPGAAAAESSVTRGEVLKQLIEAQGFPQWQGKTFSDVPPSSPYAAALESALSMGILLPTDEFSPDTPVANAESLMFAFQSLGFHHEASVARWALPPEDPRLPSYIAGFVALGKSVQPAAPASITGDPWGATTPEGLADLVRWVRLCRRSILWDVRIEEPEGTLWIHRENAGNPSSRWRLQLGSFDDPAQAHGFVQRLKSLIPLEVVSNGYDYSVVTPDLFSYAEAWAQKKLFDKVPDPLVVPAEVEHQALFWAAFSPADPCSARIAAGPQLYGSPLPLSKIGTLSGAIAAVNGGYFSGASPVGTLIADGIPVSESYQSRGMIAWNGSSVFFGSGAYRVFVGAGDDEYPVAAVNRLAPEGTAGLYTPHFGASVSKAGSGGVRYRVKDGKVTGGPSSFRRRRVIDDGEWMLLQKDGQAAELLPGAPVSLRLDWHDPALADKKVLHAVQAGPLLYAPGRRYSMEDFKPAITDLRHPRTLVGWDGSRLWWMAVDGRSSWHSNGLTLEEAARLGMRLRFSALLNLDGGGSTELWWKGHVVNRVSDGRERRLPYGIVFPRREKTS